MIPEPHTPRTPRSPRTLLQTIRARFRTIAARLVPGDRTAAAPAAEGQGSASSPTTAPTASPNPANPPEATTDPASPPEPSPPDVEPPNLRANPVIAGERGVPVTNLHRSGSKAWPLLLSVLVTLAIAAVWLMPSGTPDAPVQKNDPHATHDERFDDTVPQTVLVPPVAPVTVAPSGPPSLPTAAAAAPNAAVPLPPLSTLPPAAQQPPPALAPVPPEVLREARVSMNGSSGNRGAGEAALPRALSALEMRQRSKTLLFDAQGPHPDAAEDGAASAPPSPATSLPGGTDPEARPKGADAGGLARQLSATLASGVRAGRLPDRTLTLAKGAFLDCVLETALSSDVPGMTSCLLTRDVYGDDARVVLLERGTQLVGEYQGGIQQGKARLFVLWTRAKTPDGVLVELDSPATDALGRSGMDGFVDTHFWQRFGAALFLSSIDDALAILVAREQQRTSSASGPVILPQNTTNAAQGAATIAVGNDVQIQPTLVKNQGEHINVFVARDLDFRGVYRLRVPNAP